MITGGAGRDDLWRDLGTSLPERDTSRSGEVPVFQTGVTGSSPVCPSLAVKVHGSGTADDDRGERTDYNRPGCDPGIAGENPAGQPFSARLTSP